LVDADHGDPVADQGCGVPERVDGGLDGAGEDGPFGGHGVGYDGDGARGDDVPRLMRVQAEDRTADQCCRPLLDHPDAEIAVLHRGGEIALLERRPHGRVLALRDPAPEHECLRASADSGVQ
jgi:hypothetical protein